MQTSALQTIGPANQCPVLLSTEICDLSLFLLNGFFLQSNTQEPEAGVEGTPAHISFLLSLQEQFEFALTAVAEEVNAILKAFPQ